MSPLARGERVRLAHVIARLNIGGPAIQVAELTSRLPRDRFELRLYAGTVSPGEEEMTDVLEREGVTPRRVAGLGRALNVRQDLSALHRLAAELRQFRPHIVHTHTAKAGALGRIAAWLCAAPIVVHTFHGHVFHGYFNRWISQAFVGIERVLARSTDALITLSPRQHDEIVGAYGVVPRLQAFVVPLGFDLARFTQARKRRGELRSELGLDDDAPLVSVIGRLTAVKDLPLLFEAMAEVDAHLCIAGGGDQEEELRALAVRLGISGRTHFLGFRADPERILADTDVLALTSKNEGTPVVVIEALAAGCSVVATSVGGVPDVLEGGRWGRLVEGRLPADFGRALADALAAARERPPEVVEGARRYALEKYGIDRAVRDHVQLYEDLLTRTGIE